MLHSQEHYDLIAQFERDFRLGTARKEKESRDMWKQGHVFCHAETNQLFLAYRLGYAFGKSLISGTRLTNERQS